MSFGDIAASAVMGFRDKGWEDALKRASDLLVRPDLAYLDMNHDTDFMTVFGCLSSPSTPGIDSAYNREVYSHGVPFRMAG
jgi:hypothetical protein